MTAWTAPYTMTAETLTVARWNTDVRDNLSHLFEQIHSGTSIAGWASFTPAYTNLTVGDGVNTGKKGYAGKTTHFYIQFTFGSTSSIAANATFNFPDTAVTYLANHPVAQVIYSDAGVLYAGAAVWATTGTAALVVNGSAGTYVNVVGVSNLIPFTWATGDVILIHGSYERA